MPTNSCGDDPAFLQDPQRATRLVVSAATVAARPTTMSCYLSAAFSCPAVAHPRQSSPQPHHTLHMYSILLFLESALPPPQSITSSLSHMQDIKPCLPDRRLDHL